MVPLRQAASLLVLVLLVTGSIPVLAQTGWSPPELDHEFVETSWGYVRSAYVPPPPGTHGIFFMEGYLGASTPANGLDYDDPVAPQPTHPTHYVRMPDGVLIGVTVHHEFSGLLQDYGFALVMASVRGTGCSGGTFDLFDQTHRKDGARLIDWIGTHGYEGALGEGVENGFEEKVAMFGASYSGITALLVASERPTNLAAVSASMVIGDLYRDIAYPGGVPNVMFPGLWTLGLRPAQDYLGTVGGAMEADAICVANAAAHNAGYPTDHAGFGMYTRRVDDAMYRARSPAEFAHLIDVPIVMGQSYQDEQTGPRGGYTVWPELAPTPVANPCVPVTAAEDGGGGGGGGGGPGGPALYVPKHLVLTNGVHGTSTDNGLYFALPWFQYWMKGDLSGYADGPGFCDLFDAPVVALWEKRSAYVHPDAAGPATYTHVNNTANVTKHDGFPVPGTEWRAWSLCADGSVAEVCAAGGSRSYVYGIQRVGNWNYGSGGRAHEGSELTQRSGPDLLRWQSAALPDDLTILGPITMRLTASTTAADTEFYVTVADVAPDGDVTYLTKGMVKASHRAIDPDRSWWHEGEIVRVSHTHTAATFTDLVTPGAPVAYIMDVYPVGHTFREGHAIQVQLHTPPANDGRWGHGPVGPVAVNTVHQATLTLPVIDTVGVGPYWGCGLPDGYRCVPAEHHDGL